MANANLIRRAPHGGSDGTGKNRALKFAEMKMKTRKGKSSRSKAPKVKGMTQAQLDRMMS